MEKSQAWKLDFLQLTSEIYKLWLPPLLLIQLPRSGLEGSHVLDRLLYTKVPHSQRLYCCAAALSRDKQAETTIAPPVSSTQHRPGKAGLLSSGRVTQ